MKNLISKNILFSFLLAALFIAQSVSAATKFHRLTWDQDPSTHAVIGFSPDGTSISPYVKYGSTTNEATWATAAVTDSQTFKSSLQSHFVRLGGLTPDSAVYYQVCDDSGCGQRFWFKTAPIDNSPYVVVAGGDTRTGLSTRRKGNTLISKIRPLFIMHGGDFTDSNSASQMSTYLQDWDLTYSDDVINGVSYKRIYPVIPTHGNHEDNDYSTLCKVFGTDFNLDGICDPSDTYGGFNISPLLRAYTLNSQFQSGGWSTFAGQMNSWLSSDLVTNGSSAKWRFAQYHKPLFPHTSGKSDNPTLFGWWANEFYDNAMNLVIESDSHVAKITQALQPSGNNFIETTVGGTVYVGEGSWGAPARSANDAKSWTIDLASIQQFKVITVTPDQLDVRTAQFDASASTLSRDDRAADSTILPSGINWWEANNIGETMYLIQSSQNRSVIANGIINQSPAVSAGVDMAAHTGVNVNLQGTVNDDGLPSPPSTVTSSWSKVSGPGAVTFTNINEPATTAQFSQEGTYVLRLNADDTELTANDDITITVTVPLPAGSLILSEVLYDATGADGALEWVELYNTTASPIDLSSFSLGNGDIDYSKSVVQLSGTIAAGQTFVVGGVTSNNNNSNPTFDQAIDFEPNFQNANASVADGVALFEIMANQITATSIPIDAVVYGAANSSNLIDETGTANAPDVGDAPSGQTIERTDLTGTWVIQAIPTPGSTSSGLSTPNQAPSFTADPISKAAATEGNAYLGSLPGDATDPENDPLTFTKLTGPAWLSVALNGSLTGTPANGDIGANSWVVRVADAGQFDTATLTIEVNAATPVNRPPTFNANPINKPAATEGSAYQGSSLLGDAIDPDGDVLNFSKVSGPSWLSVASDGNLSGTPGTGDTGDNSFIVRVADPDGLDATTTLTLKVDAATVPNRAPVFTVNPVNKPVATEGSDYQGSSLSVDATDPDGDMLSYSKVTGPAWLSVDSDGSLSGTPGNSDIGANSFAVRVADPDGLDDTATLVIGVDAMTVINRAPVFTTDPMTKAGVTEGSAYQGSSLAGEATDPDNDTLIYSKLSGPAWLIVASNGDLSGTPGSSDVGTNSFEVQATDTGGFSVQATLGITVEAVASINRAPEFTNDPITKPVATKGKAYQGSLLSDASDPDGDALTFSKMSGPSWLSVAADGRLSGTPQNGDIGSNSFEVQVSDADGLSDTAILTISVEAASITITSSGAFGLMEILLLLIMVFVAAAKGWSRKKACFDVC